MFPSNKGITILHRNIVFREIQFHLIHFSLFFFAEGCDSCELVLWLVIFTFSWSIHYKLLCLIFNSFFTSVMLLASRNARLLYWGSKADASMLISDTPMSSKCHLATPIKFWFSTDFKFLITTESFSLVLDNFKENREDGW